MRRLRSLSSGAFRFALAMALIFALGAAALLWVVERAIDGYTADAVADGVSSEVAILLSEEHQLGRRELINAINRHQSAEREHELRYLLRDSAGQPVAGTLPASAALLGWHEVRIPERRDDGGSVTSLLAHGVRLHDGAVLVVASDTADLAALRRRLILFTAGFGGVIVVLVVLGGMVTGRVFLRRLDGVNAAIDRIVGGRFAERLPRIGMGAEFDQLSVNLNVMLDRIETLMDGLRQVSTDLAHDLRTPLTRLRQQLERLQVEAPASIASRVDGALAQTDHVLTVFAALLRIGAMESGAARALFQPVDLAELLDRVATAYTPEIEDGGRRLDASLAEVVIVDGDRELLAQATANLIENAAAHTNAGTRIGLRLAIEGGMAHIIVEDDGEGIPAEERDRVLRRFYRLDRSRSTPGSGLGLALVDAIVALHGGRLVLGDAAPGLQVILALPLASTGDSR